MIRSIALLACCLLLPQIALCHTYLSWVTTDGTPQPEGGCVRPHPSLFPENPLPLVTGPEMTCGWLPEAGRPAAKKCPIEAGKQITLAWRHNSNSPEDDILATTHKGPVMAYLAKSDSGEGPVWFKIYEDGYNAATGKWATDTLIEKRGLVTVTIPADIAPGNYLLRGELFALHNGYDLNDVPFVGVQPYVGCAELTITGSGSAQPAGVPIPGAYAPTDPGLHINIYQPITSPYIIPGPAVYKASSSPSPATSAPATSEPTSQPGTPKPTHKPPKAATTAPVATQEPPPKAATTAPVDPATQQPTSRPTEGSNNNNGGASVRVQLYPSSSEWWFAATVRSVPATTTIEFKDKGPYTAAWNALQTTSWGYWTFPATAPLVLPISLRLTSETGKQLVLDDIFTSWQATSFIDTLKSYDNGNTQPSSPTTAPVAPTDAPIAATDAPTSAPVAPTAAPVAPTTAPVAPTTAPVDNNNNNNGNNGNSGVKVKFHEGSNEWWFAVAFSQYSRDITSVEIKDSASVSSWASLQQQTWGGYWAYVTQGNPVVGPLTFRINGGAEFTTPAPSSNAEIQTNVQT